MMSSTPGRGAAGFFEDSWSGRPGAIGWTTALAPLAAAYGAASMAARRRAAASRRRVPGIAVIAVGNLTVGGTGKSSLARFIAERADGAGEGRAAVLLRGHGGRHGDALPAAVPDFPTYPLAVAADRFGDEAAAHRAALPERVAVLVGRDRYRAAIQAHDGYGAALAVLDDGWEQGTLSWDDLWVSLDAERPFGNGRLLPAGPLRRPAATLVEADVVAFVQETDADVPRATLDSVRRLAPKARIARFRRVLTEVTRVGERSAPDGRIPAEAARGAALITAVGAPDRVLAFAEKAGIRVLHRTSFPDHARVEPERLRRSLAAAARSGAGMALITEKDEHRWALPDDAPLPVRVIRTGLVALDPI